MRELTGGFGAHSVLECVGPEQSMQTAIGIARPGGAVGRVGVPQLRGDARVAADVLRATSTIGGGPAPVRAYIEELMPDVLEGRIKPGSVFDRTVGPRRRPGRLPRDGRPRVDQGAGHGRERPASRRRVAVTRRFEGRSRSSPARPAASGARRRSSSLARARRSRSPMSPSTAPARPPGDRGGRRPALAIRCDLTRPEDVEAAIDDAVQRFGRLNLAFNNAGIEQPVKPAAEIGVDEWDRLVAVNLRGVFLCMKREIEVMAQGAGGAIVNASSGAGVKGFAGQAAYAATKHGIIGLTKSAALDYAAHAFGSASTQSATPSARRDSRR